MSSPVNPKLGRRLRDSRPPRPAPASLTLEQRRDASVRGAQYSASLGQWIGFLWDGLNLTIFEPRTNRARALDDAHKHYDRIFHEQQPARLWTRAAA